MTEADKPVFVRAFNGLCIALREKEPDAVQMRTYFKAMGDLDVELVAMAADRISTSAGWFPKVPEWRKVAVDIAAERGAVIQAVIRKRVLAGLPPLCAACEDTGFALVGGQRYRRCECAEMRRLEVLGRRPMPALPEASEAVNNEPKLLEAVKTAVKRF